MIILPAIDLYEGKAVRLYKGDYARMTVYSDDPAAVARAFAAAGAEWIHVVDLEGARDGGTPNLGVVREIARAGLTWTNEIPNHPVRDFLLHITILKGDSPCIFPFPPCGTFPR